MTMTLSFVAEAAEGVLAMPFSFAEEAAEGVN